MRYVLFFNDNIMNDKMIGYQGFKGAKKFALTLKAVFIAIPFSLRFPFRCKNHNRAVFIAVLFSLQKSVSIRCENHFPHQRMQLAVAGEYVAGLPEIFINLKTGDHAAGFAHEQAARGEIPRIQAIFPEAVEAAGSDVSQVERSSAEATDIAR
jgi:hypothetical protein